MSPRFHLSAWFCTSIVLGGCGLQFEFRAPTSSNAAPDPADANYVTVGQTLMTRKGVQSRLAAIFKNPLTSASSPANTRVAALLRQYFEGENAMAALGGPCTPAAGKDTTLSIEKRACIKRRSLTQVSPTISITTISEAYVARACYNLMRAEDSPWRSTVTPNEHQVPLVTADVSHCVLTLVDPLRHFGDYRCTADPISEEDMPCMSLYRNYEGSGATRTPLPDYQHVTTQCPSIIVPNTLDLERMILNVAYKTGVGIGETLNDPTDGQISTLYSLFHPGLTAPSFALHALSRIRDQARASGASPAESWGQVLFTLCASPSWRILP